MNISEGVSNSDVEGFADDLNLFTPPTATALCTLVNILKNLVLWSHFLTAHNSQSFLQ